MQLHTKSLGTGAGAPLAILHGLFGMLDNWQTLARRWAERRRVILVDQRNHGRSPHAPAMGYREMATDLAETLDALHVTHVDVLGHSMGGKTAMQFALDNPARVRRLLVVDMAPRAYASGHDEIIAAMRSLNVAEAESRTALEEQLAARVPDAGTRLFLLKNLRRRSAGGYAWRLNLDVIEATYAEILASVSGEPWRGRATFVRGGASPYVRDADEPGIRELFPNARLVTVPGAGHWVHAEAPDVMLEIVERALEGREPRGGASGRL